MREFWRNWSFGCGDIPNSAYGTILKTNPPLRKLQVLTDLYNNKPHSSFSNIIPNDFFNELMFMTWSGFLMDPVYGGNAGMVGWKLTGFTGANDG